jgi:hypothetical protein
MSFHRVSTFSSLRTRLDSFRAFACNLIALRGGCWDDIYRDHAFGEMRGCAVLVIPISGKPISQVPLPLRDNWCMSNAGETKHPLIALNLVGGAQRFFKVVGKFHCWLAIGIV